MSISFDELKVEVQKLPVESKRELLLALIDELDTDSEVLKALDLAETNAKTKEIFQFHADNADSFEMEEE